MNTIIPPPLVTAFASSLMWWVHKQTPNMQLHSIANKPLAIALGLIALGLMLATVVEFWRVGTTVNPLKPTNTSSLVTSGVLRLSRNPIYLGDVLLLVAWATWLGSISALIVVPIFMAYITQFQIKPEEKALGSKFSQEFDEYCKSVRRWI
jgi:protein-S-isoprenylcysteine O-methyltransferase Ste14